MSEVARLYIKFDNDSDAKKAWNVIGEEGINLEKLSLSRNIIQCDCGDSYKDYDSFEYNARLIGNIGIRFEGERNYCSLSVGAEHSEKFKSEGEKLEILDLHKCSLCEKEITSKTGVLFEEIGYGYEDWYCMDCAKEELSERVIEMAEDNDMDLKDYIKGDKDIEELSIKEIAQLICDIDTDDSISIDVDDTHFGVGC